jgi:hypothetical protein
VAGIVPANQSLYKLEKQSGSESFRPTNPTQTNKAEGNVRWGGSVALVIGDDLDAPVLPDPDAGVSRAQIDPDGKTAPLAGHLT